jgi:hypothetical protein
VIAHFLLYTGWGSVVMVAVASVAFAFVVWNAVAMLSCLIAWALWSVCRTLARER